MNILFFIFLLFIKFIFIVLTKARFPPFECPQTIILEHLLLITLSKYLIAYFCEVVGNLYNNSKLSFQLPIVSSVP